MDWEALRQRNPKLYEVAHERVTEKEFSGEWVHTTDHGIYCCAVCGAPLFSSEAKFDHENGWPAFTSPREDSAITLVHEHEYGTETIEVECAHCHAYVGRLFCRETQDGGKICDRFCINSVSLIFRSTPPHTPQETP